MDSFLRQNNNIEKKAEKKNQKFVFKVLYDGVRIGIRARYHDKANLVFKSLGGWYHYSSKFWFFDAKVSFGRLSSKLSSELGKIEQPFDTSTSSRFVYYAWANPKEGCFSDDLDIRLFNYQGIKTICIIPAYDKLIVDRILSMGGVYNKNHDIYVIPGSPVALAKAISDCSGVPYDDIYINENVFKTFNPSHWRDVPRPKLTVGSQKFLDPSEFGPAEDEDGIETEKIKIDNLWGVPIEPLPVDEQYLDFVAKKFSLRDYQRVGVRHLLSYTSFLLADDMGLGKTRQAIAAADASCEPLCLNVVVAQASLLFNWYNEIHSLIPNSEIWVYGQKRVKKRKQDIQGFKSGARRANWIICSYTKTTEVKEMLERLGHQVNAVIFDEAHNLRNAVIRTSRAFDLASLFKRRMLLTGTPTLNSPQELFTLLKLSGHPIGQYSLAAFTKSFAKCQADRQRLGQLLRTFMLRRTKKQNLNLPPKTRTSVQISPSEQFLRDYARLEEDDTLLAVEKVGKAIELIENEKTSTIIDLVSSSSETDKHIIFVKRRESQKRILAALKAEEIDCVGFSGSDNIAYRDQCVDIFQSNPKVRAIVLTLGAGSVGLNLQKANKVIFAMLPWTYSEFEQAEARAHRGGVEHPVHSMVLQIPETLDEALWNLLVYKGEASKDILRGAGALTPEEADEKIAMNFFTRYQLGGELLTIEGPPVTRIFDSNEIEELRQSELNLAGHAEPVSIGSSVNPSTQDQAHDGELVGSYSPDTPSAVLSQGDPTPSPPQTNHSNPQGFPHFLEGLHTNIKGPTSTPPSPCAPNARSSSPHTPSAKVALSAGPSSSPAHVPAISHIGSQLKPGFNSGAVVTSKPLLKQAVSPQQAGGASTQRQRDLAMLAKSAPYPVSTSHSHQNLQDGDGLQDEKGRHADSFKVGILPANSQDALPRPPSFISGATSGSAPRHTGATHTSTSSPKKSHQRSNVGLTDLVPHFSGQWEKQPFDERQLSSNRTIAPSDNHAFKSDTSFPEGHIHAHPSTQPSGANGQHISKKSESGVMQPSSFTSPPISLSTNSKSSPPRKGFLKKNAKPDTKIIF